jgi:hypothetical protein
VKPEQLTTKVAIVKLSSLGDVIHAIPVARALRRARPGIHLPWIVEAREYALLKDHPDLDTVVPVDTRLWRRLIRRPSGMREVLGKVGRLRDRIRATRFDVALDLQGLIKSGLLTAYTGAPLRIGFTADHCREGLNCLFTNRRVRPPADAVHVVDQYLALLGPLGIPPAGRVPRADPRATLGMENFLGEQVKSRTCWYGESRRGPRERRPVAFPAPRPVRRRAQRRVLPCGGPTRFHMARQTATSNARAISRCPLTCTNWLLC